MEKKMSRAEMIAETYALTFAIDYFEYWNIHPEGNEYLIQLGKKEVQEIIKTGERPKNQQFRNELKRCYTSFNRVGLSSLFERKRIEAKDLSNEAEPIEFARREIKRLWEWEQFSVCEIIPAANIWLQYLREIEQKDLKLYFNDDRVFKRFVEVYNSRKPKEIGEAIAVLLYKKVLVDVDGSTIPTDFVGVQKPLTDAINNKFGKDFNQKTIFANNAKSFSEVLTGDLTQTTGRESLPEIHQKTKDIALELGISLAEKRLF